MNTTLEEAGNGFFPNSFDNNKKKTKYKTHKPKQRIEIFILSPS
jgi:hypothetical protein